MKKIILKLRGGLGNQLFMIAYGIGIAKKNHAELFINIDDYQKYKVRNFELNQYLKFQKKIQYDVDNSSKFRRIYYAIIYKVQQSLAYINRRCGKRFNLERMRPLYRFLVSILLNMEMASLITLINKLSLFLGIFRIYSMWMRYIKIYLIW
ncbi:hypothetical protein ABW365_16080 [Enterococcus avium]